MSALVKYPKGVRMPALQLRAVSQSQGKLAFKRYEDARIIGDDEEAVDAFANWQRLAGIMPATREGDGR